MTKRCRRRRRRRHYPRAIEKTLVGIRDDGYPDESTLPTFEELRDVVGFPQYYEEEARYDTTSSK